MLGVESQLALYYSPYVPDLASSCRTRLVEESRCESVGGARLLVRRASCVAYSAALAGLYVPIKCRQYRYRTRGTLYALK